ENDPNKAEKNRVVVMEQEIFCSNIIVPEPPMNDATELALKTQVYSGVMAHERLQMKALKEPTTDNLKLIGQSHLSVRLKQTPQKQNFATNWNPSKGDLCSWFYDISRHTDRADVGGTLRFGGRLRTGGHEFPIITSPEAMRHIALVDNATGNNFPTQEQIQAFTDELHEAITIGLLKKPPDHSRIQNLLGRLQSNIPPIKLSAFLHCLSTQAAIDIRKVDILLKMIQGSKGLAELASTKIAPLVIELREVQAKVIEYDKKMGPLTKIELEEQSQLHKKQTTLQDKLQQAIGGTMMEDIGNRLKILHYFSTNSHGLGPYQEYVKDDATKLNAKLEGNNGLKARYDSIQSYLTGTVGALPKKLR
ncbi:MAG TPA: hypothetical protein VN457_02275, partial [Chlamydiales bacterium]|nr:hypothetical protein [Chlamydiales bacterium]